VRGTSTEEKRLFLFQKGLSIKEVEVALEAAGRGIPYTQHRMVHQSLPPALPPQQYTTHLHYEYPGAFAMTRALVPSIAIASSFLYGLYMVWKRFLEPRLYGSRKHPLVLIQENLVKMQETLDLLNNGLKQLEVNIVEKLKKELESKTRPSPVEEAAIESIKKELSSIKALLLGRKQFPEAPTTLPTIKDHPVSIPSWQLTEEVKDRW